MILKKIKIENIRSYSSAEIEFPKGSVLLSGDIGSGKTSILLAIEFALFGLQPGQKGASLLKNGKDEGLVELEFEIDSNPVIITRTLKRKKTISQESAYITINGRTEEKAVTEIKNTVLQLLNYPSEFAKKTNLLYRFTVYTPQEEMKQIILEAPEIRLNTLRHVFGIDKYKRIKENSLILSAKLRENTRLKQSQISDLETLKERIKQRKDSLSEITIQVPAIEKKLSELSELKKQKEQSIKEVQDKIDEKYRLENEIEKTSILIITKKEQSVKADAELQRLKIKFEQASKDFSQKELEDITEKINLKKQVYESLNREIIELSTKISGLNSKKHELEILKEKISNLKMCPTCLQEVSQNHKHNILSQTEGEIHSINNEKINFDNEKQKKEISFSSLSSDILLLEKAKNNLETIKIKIQAIEEDHKRMDEFEKQRLSLNMDIEMLEGQIKRLKDSVSGLKKFDTIIQAREKELSDIVLMEKQSEIKKAELAKEIELGRQEISRIETEISQKEKIKDELAYTIDLESWISGQFIELIGFIEKNVMLKLRGEFSKLFNEWFSILVPDIFVVSLDEEFTPIIEQQDYELDYSYLSGGERTAIALAYRLALNQTINSMLSEIKTKGIVILDEPTDGFSQQQLDKMRDVLQQLNMEQLILVSHDQKIESFVDSIIRLKKNDGVSSTMV